MNPLHACICGVSELNKNRNSKKYKKAMTNEILVQLSPPTKYNVANQNSESFLDVMKRINNVVNIIPKFKESELLNAVISKLGLTLTSIESVKNVSKTIAMLDYSTEIQEYHISEAIQYQNLNNF